MPKRRRHPTLRSLVKDYERLGVPPDVLHPLPDPDFTCEMDWFETRGVQTVQVYPLASRDYRVHLRRMAALPHEKAIAAIGRAVRADRNEEDLDEHDVRLMLVFDVRFRPNYWLALKSAAVRLRKKEWKDTIAEAEKRFNFDEESGRPGRPKVDIMARRRKARPSVRGDLPQVAQVVHALWRERDAQAPAPATLTEFAADFCGVGTKAAIAKAWGRRSLRPKALAVALLCAKWRQKFLGLRESDVDWIVTPVWVAVSERAA
jgi:hypothetical protein